jgi:hypothetical protein
MICASRDILWIDDGIVVGVEFFWGVIDYHIYLVMAMDISTGTWRENCMLVIVEF